MPCNGSLPSVGRECRVPVPAMAHPKHGLWCPARIDHYHFRQLHDVRLPTAISRKTSTKIRAYTFFLSCIATQASSPLISGPEKFSTLPSLLLLLLLNDFPNCSSTLQLYIGRNLSYPLSVYTLATRAPGQVGLLYIKLSSSILQILLSTRLFPVV